jgi:hypothetical protein
MCDVYVYNFIRTTSSGDRLVSNRRATLERIETEGEAVMASQLVVDHTEVDDNGFVIGHANADSHPMDALWAQIRSLERRAQSRDNEALELDGVSEAAGRYMLSLESRELRKQAQALKAQRTITMADKIGQQQLSDNWLA